MEAGVKHLLNFEKIGTPVADYVKAEHQFKVFPLQRKIAEFLFDSFKLKEIAEYLRKKYCEFYLNHAKEKGRSDDRYLYLQLDFSQAVQKIIESESKQLFYFEPWMKSEGEFALRDFAAVISSIGKHTFDACQSILTEFFTVITETELQDEVSLRFQDEVTLLLIGGGTMADIRKLLSKQYKSKDSNLECRTKIMETQRFISAIKMPWVLKLKLCPSYIRFRDKGFMYVPRFCFLVFLRKLSSCIIRQTNKTVFRATGKTLIKDTWSKITEEKPQLWHEFFEAAHLAMIDSGRTFPVKIMEEFFNIWVWKFANANFGKFFQTHAKTEAVIKAARSKGGENLRQILSVASRKQKSKLYE